LCGWLVSALFALVAAISTHHQSKHRSRALTIIKLLLVGARAADSCIGDDGGGAFAAKQSVYNFDPGGPASRSLAYIYQRGFNSQQCCKKVALLRTSH
jgi:hypothetical protein